MTVNALDPWLPDDPVPVRRAATPIVVYRVPDDPMDPLEEMASVRCVGIEEREGPAPAVAEFRYAFDGLDADSPQTVEEALDTSSTLPGVIEVGNRLAVKAFDTDGDGTWIFDGFPLEWSLRLDGSVEQVIIRAVGSSIRAWDKPIGGQLYRKNQSIETAGADVQTDLIARFNPDGRPNASPSTGDSGTAPYEFPVFADPDKRGTDGSSVAYPRSWTLPMAVRHVLYTANEAETWVTNPTGSTLDDLLVAREPIAMTPFDPTDSGTYTAKDILAPDRPITGRPWPVVVHDLVKDFGFGLRFLLGEDVDGRPTTRYDLFLKQGMDAKHLYLQTRGSTLNPATSNVAGAELGRDLESLVNVWDVRGGLTRYEASFVLAPGFASQSSDASDLSAFSTQQADPTAAAGDQYRLWIFDESGEGHYLNTSTSLVTTIPSLDDVLGAPVSGVDQYVTRRRPPIGQLFTPDAKGKPLRARLAISKDYAGSYPLKWDGTGTWQPISGGWELLKDRIGVKLTLQNPNKWDIGESSGSSHPYPLGVVKAVQSIAAPDAENPVFYLRLTCVIEGDQGLTATADRESTSPLDYRVRRDIDARDRLFRQEIAKKSEFNATTSAVTHRDDGEAATAEGVASRQASDAGVFDGGVRIPRFTAKYAIGDRIDSIYGRGLGLRTDTGGTDYAPVYPSVVGRRWEFEGGQHTVLQLSDAGLDRRQYGVKGKKRSQAQIGLELGRTTPPSPRDNA